MIKDGGTVDESGNTGLWLVLGLGLILVLVSVYPG